MPDAGEPENEEAQALEAESAPTPEKETVPPPEADGAETPEDEQPPRAGDDKGFRGRAMRQSEETIGKLAQDLLEHPVITGALSAVFETRERAARAQEVAMSALNVPSANDIERLTRRLRSVSQRLEGLEDGIDQVAERLDKFGPLTELHARLDAIEAALARIEASLGTRGS